MLNHDLTTEPKAFSELTPAQKKCALSQFDWWRGEKINVRKSTFRTIRGGICAVIHAEPV